jgi:hypothetical protein
MKETSNWNNPLISCTVQSNYRSTNKLLPVRISFIISYLLLTLWFSGPLGALASLISGTYSSLCTTFCCSLLTFICHSSYNVPLVFHHYFPWYSSLLSNQHPFYPTSIHY